MPASGVKSTSSSIAGCPSSGVVLPGALIASSITPSEGADVSPSPGALVPAGAVVVPEGAPTLSSAGAIRSSAVPPSSPASSASGEDSAGAVISSNAVPGSSALLSDSNPGSPIAGAGIVSGASAPVLSVSVLSVSELSVSVLSGPDIPGIVEASGTVGTGVAVGELALSGSTVSGSASRFISSGAASSPVLLGVTPNGVGSLGLVLGLALGLILGLAPELGRAVLPAGTAGVISGVA